MSAKAMAEMMGGAAAMSTSAVASPGGSGSRATASAVSAGDRTQQPCHHQQGRARPRRLAAHGAASRAAPAPPPAARTPRAPAAGPSRTRVAGQARPRNTPTASTLVPLAPRKSRTRTGRDGRALFMAISRPRLAALQGPANAISSRHSMTLDAPLSLHRDTVRPEWIDFNGHMNVAYYVLAFDGATDKFFDWLGLDEAYRKSTNRSTFALESAHHVSARGQAGRSAALHDPAHRPRRQAPPLFPSHVPRARGLSRLDHRDHLGAYRSRRAPHRGARARPTMRGSSRSPPPTPACRGPSRPAGSSA